MTQKNTKAKALALSLMAGTTVLSACGFNKTDTAAADPVPMTQGDDSSTGANSSDGNASKAEKLYDAGTSKKSDMPVEPVRSGVSEQVQSAVNGAQEIPVSTVTEVKTDTAVSNSTVSDQKAEPTVPSVSDDTKKTDGASTPKTPSKPTDSGSKSDDGTHEEVKDPFTEKLNELAKKAADASAVLVAAQAAHNQAVEALTAAQADLDAARSTLLTKTSTLENLKLVLGSRKAAKTLADENLAKAQSEYDTAIAEAKTEYDRAVTEAAVVRMQASDANAAEYESAVNEAKTILDEAKTAAQNAYDAAVAEATNTEAASVAEADSTRADALSKAEVDYQKALSDAQAAYDAAVAEAEAKHNVNVSDAEAAYQRAVDALKNDPAYADALAKIDSTLTAQAEAVQKKSETAEALTQASTNLEDAKTAQADAEQAAADAQSAKDAADTKYAQAQEALVAAKAAVANGEALNAQAIAKVATAQKAADDAQAAKDTADKKLADAKKAAEAADSDVAAAQKEVADAEQALKDAQAVVNKGMYGFFESRNATDAMDVLDYGTTYSGAVKTEIGADGDATSLENVKATFAYMREGNQLVTTDDHFPTPAMKVSDTLMAIAEVNANVSAQTGNHAAFSGYDVADEQKHWDTAENLAANWPAPNETYSWDPYSGWYTAEKIAYEKNGSTNTGHYFNLVSGVETYTGFGISNKNGLWTYTQEFGDRFNTTYTTFENGQKVKKTDPVYTVDEYEQMFMEYYNKVMGDLNTAKAALAEKQAALDALTNSGSDAAISEAQAAVNAAKEALNNANQVLSDANITAKNTADALTAAENAELVAETDLASAGKAVADAGAEAADANASVEAAKDAVSKAETVLADAKAADETAGKAVEQADTDVATAKQNAENIAADLSADVADAKKAVDDAKASTDVADTTVTAEAAKQDAVQAAETAKSEAETQAEENHAKAVDDAANVKETAVSEAESEKSSADASAQSTYDKAVADAEETRKTAEAKADAEEQATVDTAAQKRAEAEQIAKAPVTEAETAAKQAADAVDSAQNDVNAAASDVESSMNDVTESIKTVTDAQTAVDETAKAVDEAQQASDSADQAVQDLADQHNAETNTPAESKADTGYSADVQSVEYDFNSNTITVVVD